MSRLRSVLFIIPLLVAWALPVALFIVLHDSSFEVEAKQLDDGIPLTAEVGLRTDESQQSVQIRVTLDEPQTVLAPMAGQVTAVLVSPGTQIESGTPLVAINGQIVVAQVGSTPLYRDLTIKSSGPDVAELNCLLAALSQPTECGESRFTSATRSAVRAVRPSLGLTASDVFPVANTTFLLDAGFAISEVNMRIGDVVAVGDALFGSRPTTRHVDIEATSEGESIRVGPQAAIVIERTQGIDALEFASLEDVDDEQIRDYVEEIFGTIEVPEPGSDDAKDGKVFAGFQIRLAQPLAFGVVPSSAVMTDAAGLSCLITDESPLNEGSRLLLDSGLPPSSEVGVSYVQADLAGSTILTAPTALFDEVFSCG